jgi:hypothetical protein
MAAEAERLEEIVATARLKRVIPEPRKV